MMNRQDTGARSVSASVSHALEPEATMQSADQVPDRTEVQITEEEELERRRWSSETSHKSEEDNGWMGTPLSTTTGRRHGRVRSEDKTKEEANVEVGLRKAMRLLDVSEDGKSEGEEEVEQWRIERAEKSYLDFVHEMMENSWTLEDTDGPFTSYWRTSEGQINSEEEDNDRHLEDNREGVEQHKNIEDVGKEQGQEDEWQEAYTATGRVYYYNRRTRESLWKKPSQFNASLHHPQLAAATTEEEPELHRSVMRQSLGYHPSASVSAFSNMEHQTLFCCFCGKQQSSDQLAAHFQECATAKFHKRRLSPLYLSFERALGLMSEDATLRSLHYASSFPDPTPHGRPGVTSMQDSLMLLCPKRRLSSTSKLSSTEDTPQKQPNTHDHVFGTTDGRSKESPDQRVSQDIDSSSACQASDIGAAKRKKNTDAKRKTPQSTSSTIVERPAVQHTETCRYCGRSFAEGRLAKHEAVCPRVFGHEGSWGRGTSSNQVSVPNSRNARVETPPRSARSMTSSSHKLKDHTLQQSYKKHQATLVLCPCCRRKFAPSGAQQHIAICKGVQNRPKNSIPFLRDYAIVG